MFGALKFNRSVIQREAARWDKHPEIADRNAISKAGLRKLVESCRQCYLERIPLINVPGHAEWIFRNGSNLDFAEDPQTPYTYSSLGAWPLRLARWVCCCVNGLEKIKSLIL